MVKNEKRQLAAQKAAKKNPWIQHVKQIALDRALSYKMGLATSKSTYKKQKDGKTSKIVQKVKSDSTMKKNDKKPSAVSEQPCKRCLAASTSPKQAPK